MRQKAILLLSAVSTLIPASGMAQDSSRLSPMEVLGHISGDEPLQEETTKGAYGQPEWLGDRRFATVRAYIQQDPWEVGVEQWWRSRSDGGNWSHLLQEEVEIGLPGRFQLDLYYDWVIQDHRADYSDTAIELRWALADWDVIPLNPTLYLEYKFVDPQHGGDIIEPKLLLSEEFGHGWHWAMNFVWERERTDSKNEEWAITQGISKTLIDRKLSLGVEMNFKYETAIGTRDDPEREFNIGPSIQWLPTSNSHIDIVALSGLTHDGPDFEGWLVMGFDFGSGVTGKNHDFAPISARQ
jgi:hypothetical protein